jgi:quercetin dioxygenase-like cupin family protein
MDYFQLEDVEQKEIVPGYRARFIHTDHMTVAFWDIDEGAVMPEHSHPHEQVMTLLEGTFQLTVAGDVRVLDAGSITTIQPNASHSGKALTICRAMDVFYPARDDYR